jgi:hypothetical protein
MTHLPLTPETVAAAYDYLLTCPPYSGWNLPDSDDVTFKVTKARDKFAQYIWDGGHTIEVSSASIGHTSTLIEKVGHEAIHLHLRQTGMESKSSDPNVHNIPFRKCAALACRIHGWDLKAFY